MGLLRWFAIVPRRADVEDVVEDGLDAVALGLHEVPFRVLYRLLDRLDMLYWIYRMILERRSPRADGWKIGRAG
jgi:hypothetical protein